MVATAAASVEAVEVETAAIMRPIGRRDDDSAQSISC
jgi:hypothetical protein